MARPPQEIAELAGRFVCARVTDMRAVDLARFRFDFDLTFAALTADADGRVYHRYGSRAARDPQSHLSMASLAAVLRATLAEHGTRANAPPPAGADAAKASTIEELPSFRRRDAEKSIDCVHCHTVNDFEYGEAVASGTWKRERMWVFPDPERLGLEVERDDQQKIARVDAGSPAAKAGLKSGDRLLVAGGQSVVTRADLQWVLHQLPPTATSLAVELARGEAREKATLALETGWKEADALEYAWRPFKWNLSPQPGFGGNLLDDDEKKKLALKPGAFAQRVGYLVTWGDHARFGHNAERAGLRSGDVVLAIAGQSDFKSEEHFQSWFRLTRKVGDEIELQILRDGRRRTLRMKVIE